ncbi:MAG: 2-hydroxyacyl-CoA dehydratase [Planctomycetota bacterium]|nr:2-hydroxyacyl-CoA dehydratase [Planctomycetota bacterium]
MIGITTTVPVEVIFAAGRRPLDLNNVFVAHPEAGRLVARAEAGGFPSSTCAWTRGLYGAARALGIREIVGVASGDCSHSLALCEILASEGVTVHRFGFPPSRKAGDLERELRRFAAGLGTSLEAAEAVKPELDEIRSLAGRLYQLAGEGRVASGDLFAGLLNTSDFFGDPGKCRRELAAALERAEAAAPPARPPLRLACAGVPSILSDLWEVFEGLGARFVDFETPRQFARLDSLGLGLVETYLGYTYPYDVFARIKDVRDEAERRRAAGLVHYVQSFCHRAIHDRLWREGIPLPVLTLEADRPGRVDERTRTRVEAFIEQLSP